MKNEGLMDNSHFTLYNSSNYNSKIDVNVNVIMDNFLKILIEFLLLITEKIKMKNIGHYKFIIERGVETLIHVFSLLFYYTKNIELTYYHSQKAYYFYIEFIEQISDDNVTFLQLNSKDAIMFVYKKTIFEINKKHSKENSLEELNTLTNMNNYMSIYKHIVSYVLHKNDRINYENMKLLCDSMEFISTKLNKLNKITNKINSFIIDLNAKTDDDNSSNIIDYFRTIDDYIKKQKNN